MPLLTSVVVQAKDGLGGFNPAATYGMGQGGPDRYVTSRTVRLRGPLDIPLNFFWRDPAGDQRSLHNRKL
jgi:hypothetical protein